MLVMQLLGPCYVFNPPQGTLYVFTCLYVKIRFADMYLRGLANVALAQDSSSGTVESEEQKNETKLNKVQDINIGLTGSTSK
jgi:hypothetical protein